MTPTIRVDDEVYALLQERGEAFVDTPNTVLRRILGLSESDESTGHPVGRRGGRRGEDRASRKLAKLVADDLLSPDEELVWERRNNGERHTARVGADGTLHLEDGHVADSPSAAARHLAGYEVNGWRVWRRADGTPLADLWGPARRRSPRRPPRRPRPRPRTSPRTDHVTRQLTGRPQAAGEGREQRVETGFIGLAAGHRHLQRGLGRVGARRTTGSSCSAAGCCRRGT